MNDQPEGYDYPAEVRFQISQNRLNEYTRAAGFLNMRDPDVVCLQHEYGIFGGQRGSFIVELAQNLKMPLITTLHTVLKDPGSQERQIITQLAELSARMVVMTERGVEFLRDIYHVPENKIALIPHGIIDVPFQIVGIRVKNRKFSEYFYSDPKHQLQTSIENDALIFCALCSDPILPKSSPSTELR